MSELERSISTDLTQGLGYYRWGDTETTLRKTFSSHVLVVDDDAGTFVRDVCEGLSKGKMEALRRHPIYISLSQRLLWLEDVPDPDARDFLAELGLAAEMPADGEIRLEVEDVELTVERYGPNAVSLFLAGPKKTKSRAKRKRTTATSQGGSENMAPLVPAFEGLERPQLMALAKAIAKAGDDEFGILDILRDEVALSRQAACLLHLGRHGVISLAKNPTIFAAISQVPSDEPLDGEAIARLLATVPGRCKDDWCEAPGVPVGAHFLVQTTYLSARDAYAELAKTAKAPIAGLVALAKAWAREALSAKEERGFHTALARAIERNVVFNLEGSECTPDEVLRVVEEVTDPSAYAQTLLGVLEETEFEVPIDFAVPALNAAGLPKLGELICGRRIARYDDASYQKWLDYVANRNETAEDFVEAARQCWDAGDAEVGDTYLARAAVLLGPDLPPGSEDGLRLDTVFHGANLAIGRYLVTGLRKLGQARCHSLLRRLTEGYPPSGTEVLVAAYPDPELESRFERRALRRELVEALAKK